MTVNALVDGTYRQTNLTNESSQYLAKREELRLAEIELMRQRERVAELRRHLPQGAAIEDCAFSEGPRDLSVGDTPVRTARLSELFSKTPEHERGRSLIIYHLMYGKRQTNLARCVPPGSTAPTASCITWRRISTSP
jgi:predicted dithiol-disulfide oxidoreductase (DUF899 family)